MTKSFFSQNTQDMVFYVYFWIFIFIFYKRVFSRTTIKEEEEMQYL